MRRKAANPDAVIAVIAARQHGIVTFTQLIHAGLTDGAIRRRVAAGHLHRIYRGVYAVGHPGLSHQARRMAAVLACGPGAALSHRSAADHWKLLAAAGGAIHVTIPTRAGRKQRKGLVIHRSHLPNDATLILDGIDLTGLETDGTRSEPEADFLRLCRRHRLPLPAPNRRIGPYTVDFLWRAERLVVEVDAWSTHRGRQAFEDDHGRDSFLLARGYNVLRFTDRQIRGEPEAVANLVRTKLGA